MDAKLDALTVQVAELTKENVALKKVGGQLGHKGSGLSQFPDPTEIINKKILICDNCEGEVINSNEYTAKQKVDVEINLTIREERVYARTCVFVN